VTYKHTCVQTYIRTNIQDNSDELLTSFNSDELLTSLNSDELLTSFDNDELLTSFNSDELLMRYCISYHLMCLGFRI
jgi:hypothetical protein